MQSDTASEPQIVLNQIAHDHAYAAAKAINALGIDLLDLMVSKQSQNNRSITFESLLYELSLVKNKVQSAYDAQFPGEATNV